MALDRDSMVTEICDVVGKNKAAASVSGAALQDRVVTYLNWSQRRIARFYSFSELDVTKETCTTVTSVKNYPLETGDNTLGLTRPMDIASIRLIDGANSRVLIRWSQRKFDRVYPRPANYATGRPRIYMRYGDTLELFKIPDAAYTLYVRYPQWPVELTTGAQESSYKDKDQLLVTAGIMETYLALEEYADVAVWYPKFLGQLKDAVYAEGDVDWEPQAEPFGGAEYSSGEPWIDPYGGSGDPLYGYSE